MSAELIDPFADIQPATPLSPERVKDLRTDIYAYSHQDASCIPQLLKCALAYVEACALAGHPGAVETLETMALRSTSGIEFGEPETPSWSLDPEPPNYRRGE